MKFKKGEKVCIQGRYAAVIGDVYYENDIKGGIMRNGQYYFVIYADGTTGMVSESYVEKVLPAIFYSEIDTLLTKIRDGK